MNLAISTTTMSLLVLVATSGCASLNATRGVENLWRAADAPEWTVGETTEQDVLDVLGPPSQLIPLHEDTVYYYLLERTKTRVLVTIIYNRTKATVNYDRAMFVFGAEGILKKYSLSPIEENHEG